MTVIRPSRATQAAPLPHAGRPLPRLALLLWAARSQQAAVT